MQREKRLTAAVPPGALRLAAWLPLLLAGAAMGAPAPPRILSNGILEARFGPRGLVSVRDLHGPAGARLLADECALRIDGTEIRSESRKLQLTVVEPTRITYTLDALPYQIAVEYELRPGWRFVSKRISITFPEARTHRIGLIRVWQVRLDQPVTSEFVPRSGPFPDLTKTGAYGAFLRFGNSTGLMALVQNPFLQFQRTGREFSLEYEPDMDWNAAYGPFQSDRGCVGPYTLTGRPVQTAMVPEWRFGGPPPEERQDEAELQAFTACVRAFIMTTPPRSVRVHVGWCENDYQIDVANPEGQAEYKRIIDAAAESGSNYVLYTPSNHLLGRREDSSDDWGFENILWLGLGQKVRDGSWNPKTGALPPSIREMLDYARSKKVKLLAYVYPILPFSQNPEWLVATPKQRKKVHSSLGVRSLQDFLIENLSAFYRRTGIGGYSFDYGFIIFDKTSRYAQWWGWRRVMETLRSRFPEMVIDGRQMYQWYGPWSWLAGTYPHPTSTDEQPESFVPFPDLHTDRVSADRQRFAAFWYRNLQYCPPELLPGFITHQTDRFAFDNTVPMVAHRNRDWDYLGWKYSLISSIATGGLNHVLNMLPARDPEEFAHFSAADQAFFRQWFDWTDQNRRYLLHTRTIIGQPRIGQVDGTSAIVGDRGYVFLFNPNARRLSANFRLDDSIGLAAGDRYVLAEIFPLTGRLLGQPERGAWERGEQVSVAMDGTSAVVLEIRPAPRVVTVPMLFNTAGHVALAHGSLALTNVSGEPGTAQDPLVWLPPAVRISSVSVNGSPRRFVQSANLVRVPLRFAGERFGHSRQVGSYDPNFAGGVFRGSFQIPARIFEQLAARRKAWPIPWTEQDRKTPWLAPERLLLFVQIAEPRDSMPVVLRIDGAPVPLEKAYSSVVPHAKCFVGWYADLSALQPGKRYNLTVDLPRLEPGQFQGVFFENVEPEYTRSQVSM